MGKGRILIKFPIQGNGLCFRTLIPGISRSQYTPCEIPAAGEEMEATRIFLPGPETLDDLVQVLVCKGLVPGYVVISPAEM
jgi:hypothetical protein